MMTPEEMEQNIAKHALASTETRWKCIEKLPVVEDGALHPRIALGGISCPICRDSKLVYLDCEGQDTGLVVKKPLPCVCVFYREYWSPMITHVPVHDRHIKLSTLAPSKQSTVPLERQGKIIQFLRENPDRSLIVLGPARTGKTTMCAALYQDAVKRRATAIFKGTLPAVESIWRITARDLFQEHLFYETNRTGTDDADKWQEAKEPSVSRKKIKQAQRAGHIPRLFLEELDKVALSDFKRNVLFDVIDAIYSNNGQMVVNANLNEKDFSSILSPNAAQHDVLFRRLINDGNGEIIDFFE